MATRAVQLYKRQHRRRLFIESFTATDRLDRPKGEAKNVRRYLRQPSPTADLKFAPLISFINCRVAVLLDIFTSSHARHPLGQRKKKSGKVAENLATGQIPGSVLLASTHSQVSIYVPNTPSMTQRSCSVSIDSLTQTAR